MPYQHHFSVATASPPSLIRPTLLAPALTLLLGIHSLPTAAANLDWVWDSEPTTGYCAGRYQPLAFDPLDSNLPTTSQPIYTNSDVSEYANGITSMQGNVVMQRGNQLLQSELVTLDSNTGVISVTDKVQYRRPGLLITATDGMFNTDLNQAQLQQAQLVKFDGELRATAATVNISSDDTMVLHDGKFSFCPPGDNSWHIASSKIDILPTEGVGEARHAILNLGPVPVFYLPWLSFPIDNTRRSGFLYPHLSTSSNNGLYIATPYYLNLAPQYDAVVTPHWREHRGLYLTTHGRYLGQSGLHEVKALNSVDDKVVDSQRWYIDYQSASQINDQLSADIKLARASDISLFKDYDYASSQADDNKVSSQIVFNYQLDNTWLKQATIGFKQHQQLTTNTPSYNLLPYVDLQASGKSNTDYHWQYQLSYDHFDRDNNHSALTDMQKINGQRLHFVPSVSYSWQSDYAYITPKLTTPVSVYQLTDTPAGVASQQSRSIYQLELDSGLYFDRLTNAGGQQTLEPRLYWAYAPYRQQDSLPVFDTSAISKPLYQVNRFAGPDRIGDTNRLTVGVSSRVLATDGQQKAKFSLAQIHYFDNRQVQLSTNTAIATETSSPFYGQMDYQINRQLSTSINIDWNASHSSLEAVSANMHYRADSNKVMTASYTETSSSKQNQLSLIWPLAPQWTMFAQYKGDLTNNTSLDKITGVEYANCCWKARLVNRDWLVDASTGHQHGIFLELELKGLGDSDTRLFGTGDAEIEEFMTNITGYNERFN
ncbi:MAG: LPS assembly protein LptD [Gammaproteobacteria bacterium]|nr:LPS assembly protein LptD [Gammaproteobacteria bacterium]